MQNPLGSTTQQETTEAIKERMTEVEYTSARPFITELEESVNILALMNLETPSNAALFSMVEKAIGKAVKKSKCEATLLEKFREKRVSKGSLIGSRKSISPRKLPRWQPWVKP